MIRALFMETGGGKTISPIIGTDQVTVFLMLVCIGAQGITFAPAFILVDFIGVIAT
jgi:hypothetical protein